MSFHHSPVPCSPATLVSFLIHKQAKIFSTVQSLHFWSFCLEYSSSPALPRLLALFIHSFLYSFIKHSNFVQGTVLGTRVTTVNKSEENPGSFSCYGAQSKCYLLEKTSLIHYSKEVLWMKL